MEASGILAVRTAFLRRTQALRRPKKLPRPRPRWSLALLAAAVLLGLGGGAWRRALEVRYDDLAERSQATPFEVQRLRQDLGRLDTDEAGLTRELDVRMKYLERVKAAEFSIVLDTKAKTFSLRFGDDVLREAPLIVGPSRVVTGRGGKRWTFASLTGAFSVEKKLEDASWHVPEWVYAMEGRDAPKPRPTIEKGLGKYVLVLNGEDVIHSPPPSGSPLKGPKPGSFQVPEADLAAIWRRVGPGTRVYIF
jgi:hypothetical protein